MTYMDVLLYCCTVGHQYPRLRLKYRPNLISLAGGMQALPITDPSARAIPTQVSAVPLLASFREERSFVIRRIPFLSPQSEALHPPNGRLNRCEPLAGADYRLTPSNLSAYPLLLPLLHSPPSGSAC
jgi:hypothetical protein